MSGARHSRSMPSHHHHHHHHHNSHHSKANLHHHHNHLAFINLIKLNGKDGWLTDCCLYQSKLGSEIHQERCARLVGWSINFPVESVAVVVVLKG
ncbi:hypothetical protein TYRP_005533 [Tyrophagus putrescentiae]|nr:hypothetical protein TYRP_005533 [Tyrophagus putrescentiae]